MCRGGELSAVIARPMSKWVEKEVVENVNRECSWKKTKIEKNNKILLFTEIAVKRHLEMIL